MQVRLERVWSILQVPVTAKLDWVIRYTGEEGCDLFEPALQAWEQAAAAVLERERSAYMSHMSPCLIAIATVMAMVIVIVIVIVIVVVIVMVMALTVASNFRVASSMSHGTKGSDLPCPFLGVVLVAFT